jgi:hypothetical protein
MKWTLDKLQEEASKYKTRNEFCKHGNKAYQAAQKKGLLDKICAHMEDRIPSVGKDSNNFKWTIEKLQTEASKYKTKGEFAEKSFNAYQSAIYQDLLDKICAHMPTRKRLPREKHSQFKWTLEKIQEEALKYDKREEFKRNKGGAWSAAQELGILDQVCSHMKASTNISLAEQDLFNIIIAIYAKTQRLYDRKVKIENKPYIKGFNIDIYVPELRKGIEFDGKYWHSFEVMRKSDDRKEWPDEDVRNYHELKDAWFASKNIALLHIKEEDWKKDKQACVDKCLNFLGKK